MCRAGARWVQQEILEKNPKAAVRVYTIWFDMLVADKRDLWDANLMPDQRVTHFWDEGRIVGCWYAEHQRPKGVFGRVAWDTYHLYGPEATWDDAPEPLIGSGYTIIRTRKSLASEIALFLGATPTIPEETVRFVGTLLDDSGCAS